MNGSQNFSQGRCNREKPPCKYFHPPQHLKDQLLINGRNHLALKNALMQQMGLTPGQAALVPGQVPAVVDTATECLPLTLLPHLSMSIDEQYALMAANPYLTGVPQVGSQYSPYFAPGPIMPTIMGPDPTVASPLGVVPQTVVAQQKMPRSDRLEMDMKSVGSFYYDNFAFPGMMPYKRPAAEKSGVPVYQPNATTYQQLMQLQHQPFVPVSCEYTASPAPAPTATSCASPSVAVESQTVTAVPSQLPPPPVKEETALPPSTSSASVAGTSVPLPTQTITDPAALAKEVAQQNYAKAVKLAAANQSFAAANPHLNHLNPLNYTGVALNKQALTMPPPATVARYPALPLGINTSGLSLGLNPYAVSQAHLLNITRPPQTFINPYLLRSPYPTAVTAAQAVTAAPQFITPGLIGTQYQVTVANTPMTNVAPAANIAAAAAQNNNNVVLQPYKKLKTT
ncbi:putative metal ion binding protein [Trypoxylus dichotomus]